MILAGWGTAGYLAPVPETGSFLKIPRLSVRLPIQSDWHIPGTARPGESGNVALASHRDTHFRPLRHIRQGDEIWTETPRAKVLYRVTETLVVDPENVQVLAPRAVNTLTLVTCYPFHFVGHAPQRFIVVAREEARLNPTNPLLP